MQEVPMNVLPDTTEQDPLENAQPQVELPKAMAGVAPVVGMSCEAGYKLIGDSCTMANVPFD